MAPKVKTKLNSPGLNRNLVSNLSFITSPNQERGKKVEVIQYPEIGCFLFSFITLPMNPGIYQSVKCKHSSRNHWNRNRKN